MWRVWAGYSIRSARPRSQIRSRLFGRSWIVLQTPTEPSWPTGGGKPDTQSRPGRRFGRAWTAGSTRQSPSCPHGTMLTSLQFKHRSPGGTRPTMQTRHCQRRNVLLSAYQMQRWSGSARAKATWPPITVRVRFSMNYSLAADDRLPNSYGKIGVPGRFCRLLLTQSSRQGAAPGAESPTSPGRRRFGICVVVKVRRCWRDRAGVRHRTEGG